MAALFGRNTLLRLAEGVEPADVARALEIITPWKKDYHQGTLLADNESSREQAYNRDFFVQILGHEEKPANPYTFEPKAVTAWSQIPDALVAYTDELAPVQNISAVVELKGASVDLDRPQRRADNLSPVQQGFKYKTQYRRCPFVIVSNFWEFRLYNDNQLDYECWTLDELCDPADDYLRLRTFYALLHRTNFVTPRGPSRTEQLLSDVRVQQEEIGKQFYQVYKSARLALLRDVYVRNPHIRANFDTAIEKVQKIIDRLVFACFAEDRGLLPDDTVERVVRYADSSAFGGSLWNTLLGFFDAIDVGSARLEIPNGYNGGLFAKDQELNNLTVSDDPLRSVTALSRYNFAEDLSVNILGHIFEQSITDLEEIREKVSEAQNIESALTDQAERISRRKKEGIFYTPDYIVRYIVENSVGEYLRQREDEYKKEFGLKTEILDATYERRERRAYLKYQHFLQNIKILDPACGSGAFLVYVFDYLLEENRRIDAILGGALTSYDDYVREILRNNVYGVDVNEESVEITKLSLWLKTAQKGKKLTALDRNIRCGNSLVDDAAYAGPKAFSWKSEFPDVFADGGFDVIVGNPPYVRSRDNVLDEIKPYIATTYANLFEKPNLYLLFMERSTQLLRPDGKLGFVVPNSWLGMASAEKTRRMLLERFSLDKLVNLQGESFEGVDVETVIFVLSNRAAAADHELLHQTVSTPAIEAMDYSAVRQARWATTSNAIFDLKSGSSDFGLMDRLDSSFPRLSARYEARVGLQAYEKGKGTPPQTAEDVKNHVFDYRARHDDKTFPYLEGRDVGRYFIDWSGTWLRWGPWLSQPKDFAQFSKKRILVREITGIFPTVILASMATETFLNNKSVLNILQCDPKYSLEYLLGVLNSPVIGFYHQRRAAKGNRTLFPKIVANDLKNYPIPEADPSVQMAIGSDVSQLGDLTLLRVNRSRRFRDLIANELALKKWPTALASWWKMEFDVFRSALKVKLSLKEVDDLRDVFERYRGELVSLTSEIASAEDRVNRQVFELFELTAEEIALVLGTPTPETEKEAGRKF